MISITLARCDTYTSVSYWLSLPILELGDWIDAITKANEMGGDR